MDPTIFFLLLCFILTCIYLLITNSGHRKSSSITARLPPGPYPFPIIGNMLILGDKPHQSLAVLSKKYGNFMSLKLGSKTTIVISSPNIVKELVKKHDLAFSGRSVPCVGLVIDHGNFSMVWSPINNQWRKLRRLCKEQLFASQPLDASQELRRNKMKQLVDYVHECSKDGKTISINRIVFITTLNILSNFIFSMDLAHFDSVSSSEEFKDNISGLLEVIGKPNLADFFPMLEVIDPQGLRRKTEVYASKLFAILAKIADERVRKRASSVDESSRKNDVLDYCLDITEENDSEFSLDDILHLFFDLFVAGTDTTSIASEWAMTELIRNPEKLAKTRDELKMILGNKDIIDEADIVKLPYLQAVVKEALRLHPPGPFLVPHKAEADIEVRGYIVPKGAQILTNIWASARDPGVWTKPEVFMPERFLGSGIDFRGGDFEFIPFGAGRRICPGLPLANRMLHLILGTLVYSFDWKLEGDMNPKEMDMSERFGLSLQKAVPLKAIPIKIN